jgi:hypothetical protein
MTAVLLMLLRDVVWKARVLVEDFDEAAVGGCGFQYRGIRTWDADNKGAVRLAAGLYAKVLEKHVNEWCLSLAQSALVIQLPR